MTALEIKFLIPELKNLIGGFIQKIYQEEKNVRIQIYITDKGLFELFYEPNKIFITEYKRKSSEHPDAFGMALRKYLIGQKIIDIKQHGFDRIIEIKTEKNILIFELFSKGNVILCDENKNVILPLEVQIWKDRQIVPKKPYVYPPPVIDPFSLSFEEFKKIVFSNEKSIVRFLASDMSLSSVYAEEVCIRSKIDKNMICKNMNESDILKVYNSIQSLLKDFSPRIIKKDNEYIDVIPIKLNYYDDYESIEFNTLTTALDEFFTEQSIKIKEKEAEKIKEDISKKIEIKISEQISALEKYKKFEMEAKLAGELIYKNFELIQNIINGIQNARKNNISWKEIKERIKTEDTPEAKAIKEIRENDGIVVVEVD